VSVYLTSWVGNTLVEWGRPLHASRLSASWFTETFLAIGAAITACFVFPPTVSFLVGSPDNYVGLLPPNTYHNSTLIAAMPFSIAAFGLGLRQLRDGSASRLWVDSLLGGVLVAGALCKPSYAFAFVPAYGLLRFVQINRHAWVRVIISLSLSLLPVLLLILGQSWWLSSHPEIMIYGKAEFALAFPAGWKLYLPDYTPWESFILGLGSFALPIVAYLLRPDWLQHQLHQLALGSTVVAFLQFMLVYETGERAGHGNFTWQVIAANHILYWAVAFATLNWRPASKSEQVRRAILLIAIAASTINGLVYMYAIITTGSYL
jgi:hypothetical protein